MQEQRVLDTFIDLVRIDSPSRHEAEVAAYCKAVLEELGFTVRFDNSQAVTGSDTGNLIAYRKGDAPSHIALAAHMDCVDPCIGVIPVIEGGVIRSAGDTILGSDDKAGIAAIFEALRSVRDGGTPVPDITVILTTCEELSLLGSSALETGTLAEGTPCFVFDSDGAPGTIVTASPYHYTFHAHFVGKAAHAGVEPEAGHSAIRMAAHAIEAMQLGRLDKETTANVGVIEGGREKNIVPDRCRIMGECRSLDKAKVEACRERITEALDAGAARFGGSVDIEWIFDYQGLRYEQDDPLIRTLEKAVKAAGLAVGFIVTGGGADTSMFCAQGLRAITLGTGMTNFHSTDEHILLDDLYGCARFAESIITVYGAE